MTSASAAWKACVLHSSRWVSDMDDQTIYWTLLIFGAICFAIGIAMGKEIERKKHV